jgi:cytochrome c peroxidase
VTRSFTDRRPVSEGIGDQLGRRNAPTTLNVALLHVSFWDGRAGTLEEQAGQPILNPVEMGQPDQATVVAALKKLPEYPPLFKAAYGRDVNYADLERAIAAFERTLNFIDAPFDRFLAGDLNAISADARAGWVLFNGKARCVSCHPIHSANPLGTDNRFHNIGVSARTQNFKQLARRAREALAKDSSEKALDALAVGTDLSELGRFMVTKNPADIGSFRTPQLRNIAITGPYMHDGSMNTLWDTIDHYNKGGEANPYLDGGIEALALTEQEVDQLVALMFTLTDDRFAALNQQELERQRALAQKNRPFRDEALANRKVLVFEQRVMGGAK